MRKQITRELKLKTLLAESQARVKRQEEEIEELRLHFEGMMKITKSEGAKWTGAWLHAGMVLRSTSEQNVLQDFSAILSDLYCAYQHEAAATAAAAAWDDKVPDGSNTSARRTRHDSKQDKACTGEEVYLQIFLALCAAVDRLALLQSSVPELHLFGVERGQNCTRLCGIPVSTPAKA